MLIDLPRTECPIHQVEYVTARSDASFDISPAPIRKDRSLFRQSPQWDEVIFPGPSSEWDLAIRKMDEVGSLGANWDGYGSPPIASSVKQTALRMMEFIKIVPNLPAPSIAPQSGGAMQIEWERGGRSLEFHIYPDHGIEYLTDINDEMKEGVIANSDIRAMLKLVIQTLADKP